MKHDNAITESAVLTLIVEGAVALACLAIWVVAWGMLP